ncbi:purine catabolism regulator [Streptomyces sp. 846.5]|nr:PucR family transcriptional regulator [Streptomyces sp. 846.5]TDU02160.1 purine catabolism regulator [Streptomyces sp. 846.5]
MADAAAGITARDLAGIPSLHSTLLAGAAGGDRPVLWAHTCELAEPWEWMGSGALLLTTGLNIPSEQDRQVEFLTRLARAGLSGMAVGAGMNAPPLTAAALRTADALGFPVLETAYQVPFVLLAQTVADANQRDGFARLAQIMRVYESYRATALSGDSGAGLLERLGRQVGARLYLVDGRTLRPAPGTGEPSVPEELREIVRTLVQGRTGPLPAQTGAAWGDATVLVQPVGTGGRTLLVGVVETGSPDLVVLQHVAAVASLEADRHEAAEERLFQSGSRLLSQLIRGEVDSELATLRSLRELRLGDAPWRIVTTEPAAGAGQAELRRALAARGSGFLLVAADDGLTVLIDGSETALKLLAEELGQAGRIGASGAVHSLQRIPDAVRQARWAREASRTGGPPVAVYGTDMPLFLPRTLGEAEAAVDGVLGTLVRYDTEHGTELVRSLEVFLDANRSWQEAAARLCIHRQTLAYRMRRVEELTGRDLDRLEHVTEFFLALRTRRLLD